MLEIKDIADIKEAEARITMESERIESELNSIAMQAAYYGCVVALVSMDVSCVGQRVNYKQYTINVTKKLK